MPRRSLALTFPRDLTLDEATAFFRALALAGRRGLISIEVHASERRIEHVIGYPAELHERITSSLRAHLPAVRVRDMQGDVAPALGVRIRGTSIRSTLRAEGVAPALLNALAEVRHGEVVVVQWLVSPMRQPPGPDAPPSMTRIVSSDLLGVVATNVVQKTSGPR